MNIMNGVYKKAVGIDKVLLIKRDSECENPREWSNIGKMVCFHKRYNLGDKHIYNSRRHFIQSLTEEYCDLTKIVNKYKEEYKIIYNEKEKNFPWETCDKEGCVVNSSMTEETAKEELEKYLEDCILDELTEKELYELLKEDVIILPLYIYEHSGLTINTFGFSCSWDSGQIGWIYATKKRFKEETAYSDDELFSTDKHRKPNIKELVKVRGYEDKNYYGQVKAINGEKIIVDFDFNKALSFKKIENVIETTFDNVLEVVSDRASSLLKKEVEIYDQYLTDDVYGFILYEIDVNELNSHLEQEELSRESLDIQDLEDIGVLEEIDSCWGFYGDDFENNGLADNLSENEKYLIKELNYI